MRNVTCRYLKGAFSCFNLHEGEQRICYLPTPPPLVQVLPAFCPLEQTAGGTEAPVSHLFEATLPSLHGAPKPLASSPSGMITGVSYGGFLSFVMELPQLINLSFFINF